MTFKKVVVINCSGHLLGRLASVVAKELLKGQKIICVRCEDVNISGSLHRNKLKYKAFLRLRMNSNPSRGPYHQRAPSCILWRTIRGMLRHKTIRGKKALARLELYQGVPAFLERKKKLVVPNALRALRLKPGRNFCRLGDVSGEMGWSKGDLIAKLEARRKARSSVHFSKKQSLAKQTADAKCFATSKLPKESAAVLANFGYV